MKILAIIPARGGSKAIPKKNIRNLVGKPLIYHTIESAKKSKMFDKIVVSTDSRQIYNIAKKYQVDVPFLRPKNISSDNTPIIKVIKHTIGFLEKNNSYIPDIISILQPTSPTRTEKIIIDSIKLLKKHKSTSVLSVSKTKNHPYSSFWKDNKILKPFTKNFQKYTLRQSHSDLYYPTGMIYTFWSKTLKKYDSIYGPKIIPLIIKEPELIIDIDEPFDFFISEMIIKYWKNYQKNF